MESQTKTTTVVQETEVPKKRKIFPIILALLIIVGGTFGATKYIHAMHHEETDDAQIDADISPVIPRVAGYVKEVRVKDNQRVKKGRYTLFCIPYPERWTLIINKETDTWGSFKYDPAKDLLRFDVPVQKQSESLDAFVMSFEKSSIGANLIIAWENLWVSLPFVY